ncbi:MAG: response regulator [Anaerolineae bacterium]
MDLLLTDVVLPRVSGKELADRIRALRPRIGVLYMSGYSVSAIAQHGLVDKEIVLLSKPFTVETLTEKVRTALDRAR